MPAFAIAVVQDPEKGRPSRGFRSWPDSNADPSRPAVEWARVLVISTLEAGGFGLDKYTADGYWIGDTWHESREDAEYQASFEAGEDLGGWKNVMADSRIDAVNEVLARLSQSDAG